MSSTDEKSFSVHFRPVFCILLSNLKRDIYGSCLVVSAFFGLLGSILQLFLWKGYLKEHDTRQKPSSHPHVVFNLALATALSCLTTIVIGLSLLFVPIPSQHGMISTHISPQDIYGIFPVEVLCDFGYIAAALWTLIYLIDVCLQVHKVFCRILIYYLFGWGFAAIFTVLIEVFKFAESFEIRKCTPLQDMHCVVIMWVSAIMFMFLLASCLLIAIDRKVKVDIYILSNAYTANQRTLMQHVRAKFLFFLVIFFSCWISSLVGGILILGNYGPFAQKSLSVAEAILHPLQGTFNYFIFTPRRPGQNPTSNHGHRKSTIISNKTIQQIYSTSYESSISNSIAQIPNMSSASSFRFTPCFPSFDRSFMTSYRSTDTLDTVDNSYEGTLRIGCLLGGNDSYYQ